MTKDSRHTVEDVFGYFGTQARLANLLDVKPQNLTRWRGKGIPAGLAIEIERLTGGELKAVNMPIYGKAEAASSAADPLP